MAAPWRHQEAAASSASRPRGSRARRGTSGSPARAGREARLAVMAQGDDATGQAHGAEPRELRLARVAEPVGERARPMGHRKAAAERIDPSGPQRRELLVPRTDQVVGVVVLHRLASRTAAARTATFTGSPLCLAPARPQEVRPDQPVEVAVHHPLDVADLEPRPMVLDELVGMERVRADLAAEGDLLLLAGELGELLALLLVRQPVEPRLEASPRRIAVAELRALVLALDDDARRQVGDADRRVGGVDPLAPGAGGPEDVHPDLVLPTLTSTSSTSGTT